MGFLAVCVLALGASGCVKRKVMVEPFTPATLEADPSSLRRTFVAMTWAGLDPAVSGAEAYGTDAPIITPWEESGVYRTRWLAYVKDGKLHITSVCFEQTKVTAAQGANQSPTTSTHLQRCAAQPMGRSKVAADIAAEVGVSAAPPVVEPPPEPAPPSPFAPAAE